jgi:hypothetical protein
VLFVHDRADEVLSTGLEWWAGKMLVCYSKGEGEPPLAYRKTVMKQGGREVNLIDGETIRGEPMGHGAERTPITCRARNCPKFRSNDCKPIGRLTFMLARKPGAVYQLDTKSWNSIEQLGGVLEVAFTTGGPLRGREFDLSVAMVQKGTSKFPVLSLEEVAPVIVNNERDVEVAQALLDLRGAVEGGDEVAAVKSALATALDLTNPGWRGNAQFIQRIRDIGPVAAASGLLAKYEL